MKYILSFNESINNELFTEVSVTDYYKGIQNATELSDSQLSLIRKLFKIHSLQQKDNLTLIKIKCKTEPKIVAFTNNGPLYSSTELLRISISKDSDEWYYVKHTPHEYHNYDYYKCDQWDGLISYLTKIISEMPIVESLLTTDDKLYTIISEDEFSDYIRGLKDCTLSDNQISALNKLFKVIEWDNSDFTGARIYGNKWIGIWVNDDEWYYVSGLMRLGDMYIREYAKCDSYEGLLNYLYLMFGRHNMVKESYNLDSIYKEIDSILLLNESLNISDKITSVLNKVKGLPTSVKRKALLYLVTSLLTVASFHTVYNAILSTKDKDAIEVCQKAKEDVFKDPLQMSCSQKGINHIKKEESLKLKGYKLGDGMITIGWGHAEKVGHSKFRVGQVITKQLAQKLFDEDLEDAEDGVKRIFSEWKKKGIDRKVTQDQYDALVSMTFNMGIGSLRTSDMIQYLKKGDYKTAGQEITSTNIMDKFPGLELRREKESKMFLSYLG